MEEPYYMEVSDTCEICGMPIRNTIKKEREHFKVGKEKLGSASLSCLCLYTIVAMDMCVTCRRTLYDMFKKWTEERKKQVERLVIKDFR